MRRLTPNTGHRAMLARWKASGLTPAGRLYAARLVRGLRKAGAGERVPETLLRGRWAEGKDA